MDGSGWRHGSQDLALSWFTAYCTLIHQSAPFSNATNYEMAPLPRSPNVDCFTFVTASSLRASSRLSCCSASALQADFFNNNQALDAITWGGSRSQASLPHANVAHQYCTGKESSTGTRQSQDLGNVHSPRRHNVRWIWRTGQIIVKLHSMRKRGKD